jgi:hypothetical protein
MGSGKRAYGRMSAHLSSISFTQLTFEFFGAFICVGILFGLTYWVLCSMLPHTLFSFNRGPLCFPQALYFSFITQLTIGYGDYTPEGYAQPMAVFQGILGVVIVGLWAGVFVAKWFTSGDKDSIYFANWAGYSLEEEKFFVLFVNRNVADLVDANINAVVRLESYDPIPPNVNPPYIGKSAWTFALNRVPVGILAKLRKDVDDGIKISISGTAGMTRCTNWKRYRLDEIYVMPDRNYYWQDKFTNPRFDPDFYEELASPKAPNCEPYLQHDFERDARNRDRLQQEHEDPLE